MEVRSSEDILKDLNPVQREAASHYTGPALLLAGAGSGKTKTLIHRIAYLIEKYGVYPNEILSVTFTNKAASEMRERASHLVRGADELWMSTFHSAGVRILRAYGEQIGLERGFLIYDDDDQLDLLKEIMGGLVGVGPDVNPRYLRSIIDKAKSALWGPDDLNRNAEYRVAGLPKEAAVEGYRRYQSRLRAANAIDFSDLLVETVRLFQEVPDVLERIQRRSRFIMIDEYQDTNKAQYEFARLLAAREKNLVVIGDPDQSIYKFRGADIQNILEFQQDYPDAVIYRLEHNYRSSAKVLELANKLIVHNKERLDKVLRAVKPDGADVHFNRATDHRAEADFVAGRITAAHNKGLPLSKMAILYRTNAQSRVLEESLRRGGIAARIVGGVGFYDRREIKDALSYVRLALNPRDDIALRRIVGRPKRGIGDGALSKLGEYARAHKMPLLEAFAHADEALERGPQKAKEFYEQIASFREAAELYAPHQAMKFMLDGSGYLEMLMKEGQEGKVRLENLEELLVALEEWTAEHQGADIAEFLDDAALLSSVDDGKTRRENGDVPQDAVTLMTLHNAKGLEFPEVFIVGVEEGLLPSAGSLTEAGGIEEERRLFYVGITRAMERLTLTNAENRMQYGKTNSSEDSRFLGELGDGFVTVDPYGQEVGRSSRGNWKSFQPSAPARAVEKEKKPLEGEYKGGEKVSHLKFGVGTVLAVMGFGDKQSVVVAFETAGSKTLLVKLANLTRV